MSNFENYLNPYMNSGDKDDKNDNEILNEPLGKLIENCGYYDMENLLISIYTKINLFVIVLFTSIYIVCQVNMIT